MSLALLLAATLAVEPPQPLAWDAKVDPPVAGLTAAAWALSELALKPSIAPSKCAWCETNGFDTGVRKLFNPSLTPSAFGNAGPDLASNVVAFGALSAAMLGLDAVWAFQAGGGADTWAIDATLVVETTFSALLVNQVAKFAIARARPYTIGAAPELLATAKDPADHQLSFFSGHTTFSFAVAASASTIAWLRGYPRWWVTAAVGAPLALAAGLLRLAADKHWASDVLVGLAVGSAVGVGLPLLGHGRVSAKGVTARVVPLPGGVAVSGTF